MGVVRAVRGKPEPDHVHACKTVHVAYNRQGGEMEQVGWPAGSSNGGAGRERFNNGHQYAGGSLRGSAVCARGVRAWLWERVHDRLRVVL